MASGGLVGGEAMQPLRDWDVELILPADLQRPWRVGLEKRVVAWVRVARPVAVDGRLGRWPAGATMLQCERGGGIRQTRAVTIQLAAELALAQGVGRINAKG